MASRCNSHWYLSKQSTLWNNRQKNVKCWVYPLVKIYMLGHSDILLPAESSIHEDFPLMNWGAIEDDLLAKTRNIPARYYTNSGSRRQMMMKIQIQPTLQSEAKIDSGNRVRRICPRRGYVLRNSTNWIAILKILPLWCWIRNAMEQRKLHEVPHHPCSSGIERRNWKVDQF